MSTHEVKVVRVPRIQPHPDPETISLGVVTIDGYTVIVNKAQWKEGDLAVYIEPDYVVPADAPWAAFLEGKTRIKVKRLRGTFSQGLLIPLESTGLTDVKVGDNVMERLGIVRWVEPPVSGDVESVAGTDLGSSPIYGLESWYKYQHCIPGDTEVVVTEKIHGENGRWAFRNGRMWAASHYSWKKYDPQAVVPWWRGVENNPWLATLCEANPDLVFYGECYGNVGKMKYGVAQNHRGVVIFDALRKGKFLDYDELVAIVGAGHMAPVLYRGPHKGVDIPALAEGKTILGKGAHIREGVVIKPAVEMSAIEIGRVALKCVSNTFLEKM